MNETVMLWSAGGVLLTMIGGIFVITNNKLDKEDFKEHCKDQKKDHEQFWDSINKNNELLARVDERLKRGNNE